jgi:hypothetical protein
MSTFLQFEKSLKFKSNGLSAGAQTKMRQALSDARTANEQFVIAFASLDPKILRALNDSGQNGCVISDKDFQLITENTDIKDAQPLVVVPDSAQPAEVKPVSGS